MKDAFILERGPGLPFRFLYNEYYSLCITFILL